MNYLVIKEFDGKHVEVFTAKNCFSGILNFDLNKEVLVINPADKYDQYHWLSTTIDQSHVIAIRLLKPKEIIHDDEVADNYDNSDTDCTKTCTRHQTCISKRERVI